ncbi:MAG TPA: DUF58 domain-containing protein [Thermoanaerobaculia bacterium]|nr:DUF58 domain-containing protein [Thermoanaerobaculia bacterium]
MRGPRRRPVPEGIRITTVGLWYVLLSIVVAIAATNTGNNSLYMVMAMVLAILILSGLLSRENVRGLEIELQPPGEVFANRPFSVGFTMKNRSRFFPRWFLLFTVSKSAQPMLVTFLPKQGRSAGQLEMMIRARGRHRFPHAHVSSLFPFGFFRKGVRYPVDLDVLVYPEIFEAASVRQTETAQQMGEDASRRAGWGHGLHALRHFRSGDDPRGIHWKQTARTGNLVYMERESEQSRRLAILFDNGVGDLADDAARGRFERLVSEAATAALDHLSRGYEVELVTRDHVLHFAGGARQRIAILETLALIDAQPASPEPLRSSDRRARQLRVHLDLDPSPSSHHLRAVR